MVLIKDGFLQIYHKLEHARCQYRQTPVCTFVELLVILDVVPIKAKRQSKKSSNRTVDNDGTLILTENHGHMKDHTALPQTMDRSVEARMCQK